MPLFRTQPPAPLLLQFLETANLKTLDDTTWFVAHSIDLKKFEPLLLELQPYYFPSKDIYTTRPLTPALAITILRQILREHSRKLRTKEIRHQTWYSIEPAATGMTVEF
jgi:hypothetical protein